MVDPATAMMIAQVGLPLGQSFADNSAEKKKKKAYQKYQEQQRAAALENYRYQTRALQNRFAEEKEATAYSIQNNIIQNMQAKATAQASAAGSGIMGSTIDNLFKVYDRAAAASTYIAKRNLHLKGLQTSDSLDAARIEALNTINGIQTYLGVGFTTQLLAGIGNGLTAGIDTYFKQQYYANDNTGVKLNLQNATTR